MILGALHCALPIFSIVAVMLGLPTNLSLLNGSIGGSGERPASYAIEWFLLALTH
jgi:hypothetical protein